MRNFGKRDLIGLVGSLGGLHAATRLLFGETVNGWLLLIIAVFVGACAAVPIGTYWMKRYQDWPFCPRDNQARRYRILIACIGFFVLVAFWSNRLVHISPPQAVEAPLVATSSGSRSTSNHGTFERFDAEYDFRVRINGFGGEVVGDTYELQIVTGLLGFDVAIDANKLL